jgi:hypothetical protein
MSCLQIRCLLFLAATIIAHGVIHTPLIDISSLMVGLLALSSFLVDRKLASENPLSLVKIYGASRVSKNTKNFTKK